MKPVKLVSMGGVDRPSSAFGFLFRMFNDKHILPFKQPLRAVAAFFISTARVRTTLSIYRAVGPSPVASITKRLVDKLRGSGVKSEACFLYSKPYLRGIAEFSVALYPFYSHTTHGRIIERSRKLLAPFCIFPEYVDIIAGMIEKAMDDIPEGLKVAVLLSAHSLPESVSRKRNDPYRNDIEVFCSLIRRTVKAPVFISFQSRMGRIKWLEPTTAEMIKELSDKFDALIMLPVSFTIDNTETVYEMDQVYSNLAYRCGFKYFYRVSCVNDSDEFVRFFATVIGEKR